jgi:hypothetical protein
MGDQVIYALYVVDSLAKEALATLNVGVMSLLGGKR